MKFVADEGVDRQIVERLRKDGHTVWYIAEMDPGISDQEVLSLANQERAVLLSGDKDFGELVYRQHLINPGLILLRLAGMLPEAKAELVARAMDAHATEFLDSFSVLSSHAIRIRRHET